MIDDRPGRGVRLEASGQLEPVHAGELDVHQDRAVVQRARARERFGRVRRRRDLVALALRGARARASGSVRCHRRPGSARPSSAAMAPWALGRIAEEVLPWPGDARRRRRAALRLDDALRSSASPRPVPWYRFAVPASSCWNSVNRRVQVFGADADPACPRPRSGTVRRLAAATRIVDPARLRRELERVREIVVEDLLELAGIDATIAAAPDRSRCSTRMLLRRRPARAGCRAPPGRSA